MFFLISTFHNLSLYPNGSLSKDRLKLTFSQFENLNLILNKALQSKCKAEVMIIKYAHRCFDCQIHYSGLIYLTNQVFPPLYQHNKREQPTM